MSGGPPPVPGGRSARGARGRPPRARGAPRGRAATAPPPSPPLAPDLRATGSPRPSALTAPPPPAAAPARAPRPGRRRPAGPAARAGLVALAVIAVGWFANTLFQPFKGEGEGEVRVVIPQGASLGEIAELLEAEGVVDSSSFFQLRARIAGRSGDLKPGPYTLAERHGLRRRARHARGGRAAERRDGDHPRGPLARRDRAHGHAGSGATTGAPRAARRCSTRATTAPAARARLEGFLFPATYELKKGQPVRKLVDQQLSAFKQNFAKVDMRYAKRKNLTPLRRADHRLAGRARGARWRGSGR